VKKKVVFVGAFNKNTTNIGGQLFACTSLVESELSDVIRWRLIDTTAETNQFRSKWNRSYYAAARLVNFLWSLVSFRPASVLIFFAHRGSFLEKGLMAVLAKMTGKKVILCGRSGLLITDITTSNFWRRFARTIFRWADVVVCQSIGWERFFIANLGAVTRYRVISNWISTGQYEDVRRMRNTEISGGNISILFLGWVTKDKGIFELLTAFSKLKGDNLRLIIAGDGDELESARAEARRLGIGNITTFPGWVKGDAKRDWLMQADVFVLPSYYEGLPNSLLEAMASAIAVVATRVGGIPDLVTDGHNGFLVDAKDPDDLADKIQMLVDDSRKRRLFAERGYEHVLNNHSLRAAVSAFKEIL
jgi:glycosyltransferase involved in cell wall biosynthesis